MPGGYKPFWGTGGGDDVRGDGKYGGDRGYIGYGGDRDRNNLQITQGG